MEPALSSFQNLRPPHRILLLCLSALLPLLCFPQDARRPSFWIATLTYFAITADYSFRLSRRGTWGRHAWSINRRSPVLSWAWLALAMVAWGTQLTAWYLAAPWMLTYYGLRFGAYRKLAGTLALLSAGVVLATDFCPLDKFAAAIVGGSLVALLVDLGWNHQLKKFGGLTPAEIPPRPEP